MATAGSNGTTNRGHPAMHLCITRTLTIRGVAADLAFPGPAGPMGARGNRRKLPGAENQPKCVAPRPISAPCGEVADRKNRAAGAGSMFCVRIVGPVPPLTGLGKSGFLRSGCGFSGSQAGANGQLDGVGRVVGPWFAVEASNRHAEQAAPLPHIRPETQMVSQSKRDERIANCTFPGADLHPNASPNFQRPLRLRRQGDREPIDAKGPLHRRARRRARPRQEDGSSLRA